MARFVAGDPIRGLAALAVMAWHAAFLTLQAANLHTGIGADLEVAVVYGNLIGDPFRALALAIDVFFVLSAYLISRPFVRAYVHGARRPSLRRYARNRILRIYPTFLVVCALVMVVYGLEGLPVANTIGVLLLTDVAGMGWSQRVAPTWSLNVEVAFYASMPLAVLAIGVATRRLRRPRARAGLIAGLALAAGAASLAGAWNGFTYATLVGSFWAFVPGILLAAAEPFAAPALAGRDRVAAFAQRMALGGFLLLIVAFMPIVRVAGGGAGKLTGIVGAGLIVGGLLVAEWAGRRPPRVLDNRVLHWLGERSYSFFLLHWWIGLEVSELVAGWGLGPKKALLATLLLTLAATLPAAEVLHRLVERPAMRRGRRSPRPQPAPEASPA